MSDIDADLERLIGFLAHERNRQSSCTPDIVERFDRAIRQHLLANGEPLLDGSVPPESDPDDLAAEVERLRAASEGVDMLIAQAERRGAVKALRSEADRAERARLDWRNSVREIRLSADQIKSGADL